MKNYLILLIGLFLSIRVAFSQAEGMKEVFDDAEYFFYSESYNDALLNYMKIYKRGYQTNANINFKIGYCYLHTSDKTKAIPYLEAAVTNTSVKYKEGTLKEDKAPLEAMLYLGNAYRIIGSLDKAIEQYDKYLNAVPPGKPTDEVNYAKKQKDACGVAVELEKNPVKCNVKVLEKTINNPSANFNPVVTPNETVLAYVSRLRFYDAVFVCKRVKEKWSTPENITPQIQSDGNQYTCSISSDGKTLFLTKEDNYDSDIYMSKYDGKTWSKSIPLNKNINSKYWESHACISNDGKTLFFASNRRGGKGGMDIYMSTLGNNNDWGTAVNLGAPINTDLDDDYPFLSEDGNILYFSSQGHKTMGGFDIFYSIKNGNTWSEPKNIGYPINTTDDDIFFCPILNGTVAYQAIYPKEGGLGDLDIVRIEIDKPVALYNIKGNYKELFGDQNINRIQALNIKSKEIINVNQNKVNKSFEFNACSGEYVLLFDNKQTNAFTIPEMTLGTSYIVIPELLGLADHSKIVLK